MKLKTIVILSFLAFSSQSFSMFEDFNINDISCYHKIGRISCSSSGYWSGYNGSVCEAKIRYRAYTGKSTIATLRGSGYRTTGGDSLSRLTLGLSDAFSNQVNAVNAKIEAKKEINKQVRDIKDLVDKCH